MSASTNSSWKRGLPLCDALSPSRERGRSQFHRGTRTPVIRGRSPARRTSRPPSSTMAANTSPSPSTVSPRRAIRVKVNGMGDGSQAANPASSNEREMGTMNHHSGILTSTPQQDISYISYRTSQLGDTMHTSWGVSQTQTHNHVPSQPLPTLSRNPYRNLINRQEPHRCHHNQCRSPTLCPSRRESNNPYRNRRSPQHAFSFTYSNLSVREALPNLRPYGDKPSPPTEREIIATSIRSENQPEDITLDFLVRHEQENRRQVMASISNSLQSSNPYHSPIRPQTPATPRLRPQGYVGNETPQPVQHSAQMSIQTMRAGRETQMGAPAEIKIRSQQEGVATRRHHGDDSESEHNIRRRQKRQSEIMGRAAAEHFSSAETTQQQSRAPQSSILKASTRQRQEQQRQVILAAQQQATFASASIHSRRTRISEATPTVQVEGLPTTIAGAARAYKERLAREAASTQSCGTEATPTAQVEDLPSTIAEATRAYEKKIARQAASTAQNTATETSTGDKTFHSTQTRERERVERESGEEDRAEQERFKQSLRDKIEFLESMIQLERADTAEQERAEREIEERKEMEIDEEGSRSTAGSDGDWEMV